MPSRRQFVRQLAAGGGLVALGSRLSHAAGAAAKPMSLLILGGTGAIGPFHVRAPRRCVQPGENPG
jgi:hypothetical protein